MDQTGQGGSLGSSCQTKRVPTADAIDFLAQRCGFRTADRLRARCESVFRGIELEGRSVLDVGCGNGMLGLWAAVHGASRVLGIEPEADGSDSGMLTAFRESVNQLGLQSVVSARENFLQDLRPSDGQFDVAVLFNVINHLNESAASHLHESVEAQRAYTAILEEFRAMLVPGAMVSVADCSSSNFWNDIGIRAPLAPTIDWSKHQPPQIWTRIFGRAGFETLAVRWSPLYPFGRFSSNRLVHYFSVSHFVMQLRVT